MRGTAGCAATEICLNTPASRNLHAVLLVNRNTQGLHHLRWRQLSLPSAAGFIPKPRSFFGTMLGRPLAPSHQQGSFECACPLGTQDAATGCANDTKAVR